MEENMVINDDRMKESEISIGAVMNRLINGNISEDMCEVIKRNPEISDKLNIHHDEISAMLCMKAKLAYCPEPLAYSINEQGRVDYIYENINNPSIILAGENEKRFMDAILSYYAMEDEYREKVKNIQERVAKYQNSSKYEAMAEEREIGILMDVLLNRFSVGGAREPFPIIDAIFEKCDLKDAYNMDDNGMALRWKAGQALESKGLLSKGTINKIISDAGFSVDAIKAGINRNKIDRMRVWDVCVSPLEESVGKTICCKIDGEAQEARILSASDMLRNDLLADEKGLAIRMYKDVLDSTREKNQWFDDGKILERVSMPYVDRLIDIYRNGMNEQDLMLAKASEFEEVDSFWRDSMMLGMEQYSIEEQKEFAFDTLVDYIKDLMPGQLTDDEIVKLVGVESINSIKGKELESNFMKLPELFFPLIEQCGKYDRKMIDYAKVLREIGRIIPTMAYNSMDYFLDQRFREEWDSAGDEDDYGQPIGCYYYPNERMENPAEKFPPNLLNEMQWSALGSKYRGEAASFIPDRAFQKNRITGVQVYASGDDDVNIRCIVDGKQQGGRRLSELDTVEYLFENTDLNELAVKYFEDAFVWEEDRNVSMRR